MSITLLTTTLGTNCQIISMLLRDHFVDTMYIENEGFKWKLAMIIICVDSIYSDTTNNQWNIAILQSQWNVIDIVWIVIEWSFTLWAQVRIEASPSNCISLSSFKTSEWSIQSTLDFVYVINSSTYDEIHHVWW